MEEDIESEVELTPDLPFPDFIAQVENRVDPFVMSFRELEQAYFNFKRQEKINELSEPYTGVDWERDQIIFRESYLHTGSYLLSQVSDYIKVYVPLQ